MGKTNVTTKLQPKTCTLDLTYRNGASLSKDNLIFWMALYLFPLQAKNNILIQLNSIVVSDGTKDLLGIA